MAVTRQVFILFLGAVLVKSHHLHHSHNPHQHHHHHHHQNDFPNFFDATLYPGIFGVGLFGSDIFGNGGTQTDGYIAPDNNYNGDIDQGTNYTPSMGVNNVGVIIPGQSDVNIEQPNEPDVHLNIPVPNEPLTPDIHGLNSHPNEVPVNNANINLPANTNEQSNEPQREPNLDNHVDINESQLNIVPGNVEGPKTNVDAGLNIPARDNVLSETTQENNPKQKNEDSIVHKVPEFLDDDIKKGIVMADPELKYNINESHEPNILDDAEGHHSNAVQGLDSKNKSEEKNYDSIQNEKTDLRLNNDDFKKGTSMEDPELKNNNTEGLDKYSDSVVFPDDIDEAKKQNQVNTSDVQQNLPNRFSAEDSDKKYPSVAPGVVPLSNNYIPGQWITSNNNAQTIPTSNNQGTQNQYTNQPNKFVYVVKPNQQVPVNNGNELPYVNVVRNSNGDYTVVKTPNNNGKPYESGTSNHNSAVNNPGQLYVSANSEVNSPNQGYISGNAGVNNPRQIYVPVNGNSGVNDAGQTYVIADGANSGASNPGQTYVIADGANSGVNNPGQTYVLANGAASGVNNSDQTYVITDGANSGAHNPGQTYVIGNGANSGVNNPGQTYVLANGAVSGANNPDQTYPITNSANSEINNPGQTFVIADGTNSGVNNPGQTYVITNGANSGINNPGQTSTITNDANSGINIPGRVYASGYSGINNPSQIYVPVNSGENNAGSTYVPSSTVQAINGVYYYVIQLRNGQTILVPVNKGNGQNGQWNGQSNNGQIYVPVNYNPGQGNNPTGNVVLGNKPTGNVVPLGSSGNVVTGGPTNNVPLLISYKDKDGKHEEKNVKVDQVKDEKD